MAKRKTRIHGKRVVIPASRPSRFIAVGLFLTLVMAGAVFAEWGSLLTAQKPRPSSKPATPLETPTPESLNGAPSKEYIYAGGRLIATEEPPAGGCTAPAAPTGLTATAGNAQVTLNWNAVANATSYNVKRATVRVVG